MALGNNPTPSEMVKEVKTLGFEKANISDVPVEYGSGKDSVKNKTPYDETDVDGQGNVIDRTNTVDGNFSAAFGSRNNIGSGSSETFVTGGKNSTTHTEDALVSGYENTVSSSHQSIIGGYDNNVKASESVVVGEGNTLDGTITGASYKTDTRSMAVFGNSNSVGINNKHSLIAGEDNEMGINGKWNFEVGAHHNVGRNNECVNVLGWTNTTNGYLTDSTLAGYENTAYGGASGNNTFSVYMLGHSNDNQDPSNPSKGLSEVYQIGHGLLAKHRGQVILGKYNRGNVSEVNDILTVGCGTSSNSRSNCFGTGNNGTDNYIRVGATPLTESKLTDLVDKAVMNFEVDGNTFSSNNSAELKTINGDYDGLHNKLATGNDLANKMDKTLTGTSAPTTSTEGQLGQLYIDTTNNKTYQCYAITTENNTTTYTWREISGGGTATDVQVDDVSQVVSGTANLKTISGDYNASTNKLATQKNIPLYNANEYKAFTFYDYFSNYSPEPDTQHAGLTSIPKFNLSKFTDLAIGDKILIFCKWYCTDSTNSVFYNYVDNLVLSATISGTSSSGSSFTLTNVGSIGTGGGLGSVVDSRNFAYKTEIANMVTHDDSVTTANESTFADQYYTKGQIIDLIYPINSIFISVSNVNPQTYLPNTTWVAIAAGKTLWTTTTAGEGGQDVQAGLPNIKAQFGVRYGTNAQNTFIGQLSGNAINVYSTASDAPSSGSSGGEQQLTFDASRYSSIYKNDVATVQPPAIKVYMWQRTT